MSKLLSPFPIKITEKQRKWLEKQKERTGNTFTATIRNLIQKEVDKEKQ